MTQPTPASSTATPSRRTTAPPATVTAVVVARDREGTGQVLSALLAQDRLPDRILLVDEPTKGLAPKIVSQVADALAEAAKVVSILLVEQNARAALRRANRGYVLEIGKIVLAGTGAELLESDEVRKAYLGED